MQVNQSTISDTKTKLTVTADAADLTSIKKHVMQKLAKNVKVAGFRAGKVPLDVAEKNLDPNFVQTEVLDDAVNHFYSDAVNAKQVRVVSQPKIELVKFVPYTELEFTAEVETIGKVTVADYKKITAKKDEVKVTAADVDEVLTRLQTQAAEYTVVERAAKLTDRTTLDFDGADAKGKAIAGGSGKDYQLVLGSGTFIPGFEEELVGLKKGATKTFTITFPKDYGVATLAGQPITFKITLNNIEETKTQPIDDAFAAKVGPFQDVAALKTDIKKQITTERENQSQRAYEDVVIKDLVKKSKVSLPEALVAEQMSAVDQEFRQTLTYRGQTFPEYLEASGQTEEQYSENELKPAAEERIKAGLVLSEIADIENIAVTPEEIEIRIQIMKGQYSSPEAAAELDKPENRRDIGNRLLTEKTIQKILSFSK